jgi:hypothetical protein
MRQACCYDRRSMGKSEDLIRELAAAEGLTGEEADTLQKILRQRREKREAADRTLARREEPGYIDFPSSPVSRSSRAIERYGDETPAEALERWMDDEQADPEGVYGPGGATAGGIFGDGPIAMPDYDPVAHRRTEARAGGVAQVKLVQVLERLMRRLDEAEGRKALPGAAPPQLPRGRRGR